MNEDTFERQLAPLWARAQSGDAAAYRAALTLIGSRLRAYFMRRLGSWPEEVEDLVQETLLTIHLRRGTHLPGLPVANWLFAIAGYKLADLYRRRARDPIADVRPEAEEHERQDPAQEELPVRRDLMALLGRLPEVQRTAIVLLKIEGLTAVEAAKRSGVSASNLKVRAHRGLRRLAELVRSQR